VNIDQLANQFCHFFDDAAFHDTDRPGFRQRIITGDHLQLCFWRIVGGAQGSFMHQHESNEQLGIIMRGGLDFRIGHPETDVRSVLREGDVYLAPMSVWHGDSVFIGDDEYDECWILDVFSPPRADLSAAQEAADLTSSGGTS
jgi:quercetin dioxygenase-like cupin family protein